MNVRKRMFSGPPAALILTCVLFGQPDRERQGKALFRSQCASCHGVGGHGGVRGPDLTTGSWAHGGSDAELVRTISNGVPGTQMPGHDLTEEELGSVIAYLRSIQQPATATAAGDPRRGEALFTGALKCSTCHMVNGRGGILGPELSRIGSARPRARLIEAIREPSRHLAENPSFADFIGRDAVQFYDTVTAVTQDGKTIVGVPLNEDSFTIQILDTGESIHMLDKKSLKSLRHEARSLMPAYGANVLSAEQLEDVLAYLQSLRAPSPAAGKEAPHANP